MDGKQNVLIMSAIASAETLAAAIARQLNCELDVVGSRKACLAALRRKDYALLIVDEALIEGDTDAAELLWKHSGLAVPLQVNLAISGTSRLVREARTALSRREQEQAVAMRAASTLIQGELKSTVAGLLLQSELALAASTGSPKLAEKLKLMVELAGNLRQQLERASASSLAGPIRVSQPAQQIPA